MKPQKALHFHLEEAKRNPKYKGKAYAVLEKYDGWYVYVDIVNGKSQGIRSKTDRLIPSLALYNEYLAETDFWKCPNCRIIMEATIPGLDFHTLNGQLNQKQRELDNVVFYCHDMVDDHAHFQERYRKLRKCLEDISHNSFKLAPVINVSSLPEVWMQHAQDVWARGGEGVILKAVNASYAPDKRDYTLMKIKQEETLDLLCIGVKRGEGKYAGTLGAITVKDKAGKHYDVSGMSDGERDSWWHSPDRIVGRVVEVQCMKRLENGLREPRFKAIRHDKTEQDID